MPLIGPKPLPTSIGIGTDIARIPRFIGLIRKHRGISLKPFGLKLFNQLEQPDWQVKLQRYLENPSRVREREVANYLAGRWALKEATIKAHSHRKLTLHDISILRDPEIKDGIGVVQKAANELDSMHSTKPYILIEPPRKYVTFSEEVASLRRLRGFRIRADGNIRPNKASLDPSNPERQLGVWKRAVKIRMQDRQQADGSLSHDKDYAIAICQALNTPVEEDTIIVDNGEGEPIHECEQGDWLYNPDQDEMERVENEIIEEDEEMVNLSLMAEEQDPWRGSKQKTSS